MQNKFHMFANDAAKHSGYIFCSERHLAQLMLIISSPKNNQDISAQSFAHTGLADMHLWFKNPWN